MLLASSKAGAAAASLAPAHPLMGAPYISHAARRLISNSTVAMGHGSHSSDNDPHILEQEKQRNLQGKTPDIIPGNAGFNPALASDSEAAIRAERAPSMPMEELQQHSVNIIQHLHHDADHQGSDEVHDPSQSPAIKDNMENSKKKTDQHHPV